MKRSNRSQEGRHTDFFYCQRISSVDVQPGGNAGARRAVLVTRSSRAHEGTKAASSGQRRDGPTSWRGGRVVEGTGLEIQKCRGRSATVCKRFAYSHAASRAPPDSQNL